MPRRYSEEEQNMILKLINYFTKERDAGKPLLPLTVILERVSDALGVGITTVKKISSHGMTNDEDYKAATTTAIQRTRGRPLYRVHEHIIRNRIYAMFVGGEHVTLVSLKTNLLNIDGVEISKASLCRGLQALKFRWRKDAISNRKYLMEQPYVVEKRVRFLRAYTDNFTSRFALKPVFLDETWIYSKGAFRNSWQDGSIKTVKQKSSEGVRYIIFHAGSETGFVANASLIFKSGSKSGDYHDAMNAENFEKWFQEQLIPNLEEPSLIVMDNASYHSRLLEKIPNSSWSKQLLLQWLQDRNIEYPNTSMKIDLWNIVKKYLPEKNICKHLDEVALQYGHKVLRLPPYHCQFNPIELVWSECKRYYDSRICSVNPVTANAVLILWNEALDKVTPDKWTNYCRHTNNLIHSTWERDRYLDCSDILPVIINIDDSDLSDVSSDDESVSNT